MLARAASWELGFRSLPVERTTLHRRRTELVPRRLRSNASAGDLDAAEQDRTMHPHVAAADGPADEAGTGSTSGRAPSSADAERFFDVYTVAGRGKPHGGLCSATLGRRSPETGMQHVGGRRRVRTIRRGDSEAARGHKTPSTPRIFFPKEAPWTARHHARPRSALGCESAVFHHGRRTAPSAATRSIPTPDVNIRFGHRRTSQGANIGR